MSDRCSHSLAPCFMRMRLENLLYLSATIPPLQLSLDHVQVHLPSTIFPRYVFSVFVSLSVPQDSSEAFSAYVSQRDVKPKSN